MTQRKFLSEFGLNMINGYTMLLQQDHLNQVDESGIKPHIYLVARRPKISIEPESIKINRNTVTGLFQKQVKDKVIPIPFETPNLLGTDRVTLKCDYPYTEYAFKDENNRVIADGKCALLLGSLGYMFKEHLDLEVLYIGQSFGTDGDRIASERLKSHSTLQGIYAEAIRNSPDQDIWLILSTFEPLLLASFDGRRKEFGTSMEEDTSHIHEVLGKDISEQQKINFTEASLIKYFQPSYNTIYKNTFPNPAHVTYSECYDIELNMVCVEFQTENICTRLWSESVQPRWTHFCEFPLHSKDDRIYMFDFDK